MQRLLTAPLDHSVAIRYPSGADDETLVDFYGRVIEQATGVFADFDPHQPPETVVVTYGRLTSAVLSAARQCEKRPGIVLLERLRPYGAIVEQLSSLIECGVRKIIFCEEGILSGGEGMNLVHALRSHRAGMTLPDLRILAVNADEAIPEPGIEQSTWDAAHIGVLDIKGAIES
jgi:deoxyxylulose-5-phosphate synthase